MTSPNIKEDIHDEKLELYKSCVYCPSENPNIFEICMYSDKNFKSFAVELEELQKLRTNINKMIINRNFNTKK